MTMDAKRAFNYLQSLVDNDVSDPDDGLDDSDYESDFQSEYNGEDSGTGSDDSDTTNIDFTQPQASGDTNSNISWSETLSGVNVATFERESGPNHDLTFEDRPIDFFHLYIPDMSVHIAHFLTDLRYINVLQKIRM